MGSTPSSPVPNKWRKVSSAVVKAAAAATVNNPATTSCTNPATGADAAAAAAVQAAGGVGGSKPSAICGCPVTHTKGSASQSCSAHSAAGSGGSGGSDDAALGPSTCVSCKNGLSMSQWWLETNSVVGSVIENVRCKHITVGASDAHFVGQSPCCMVARMAGEVARLFASDEFTASEKDTFWTRLTGADTTGVDWSSQAAIAHAFQDYVQLNCDSVGDSNNQVSTTEVENLLLGLDSTISCDDLQIAVSDTSQNVVCVINGFHAAQCAVDPESCKAPAPPFVMPEYGWVLIGIGAVVVSLAAVALLSVAARKRRLLLSGIGTLRRIGGPDLGTAGLGRVMGVESAGGVIADELRGHVGGGL